MGEGHEGTAESLWQTIKSDLSNATGPRIAGAICVIAWLAFQWGWGNDVVLPTIVFRVFEWIDDGVHWPRAITSVVAATGAGSLFWGATQALDAVVVLTALGLVPGITNRITRMLKQQGWIKPYTELSLATKMLIAYASGASALCLIDVFATGRRGLRQRRRMVAESVALAVGTVAVVIVIVTGALAIGARVPASRGTTEFVVRYARNPITWMAIYGSAVASTALFGRFNQPRQGQPGSLGSES